MTITIRRCTGWEGSAMGMRIMVNGEKAATINRHQVLRVELPASKNSLKVRQLGIRSNEIEVEDGDILEVKHKRWYRALFPLMIVITFIMSVILDLPHKSFILPVHMLFIVLAHITRGLVIKKVG